MAEGGRVTFLRELWYLQCCRYLIRDRTIRPALSVMMKVLLAQYTGDFFRVPCTLCTVISAHLFLKEVGS